MITKKISGLNVYFNENYELMLSIAAVYLKHNRDSREILNYIECPNTEYLNELDRLINLDDIKDITDDILNFRDESVMIEISLKGRNYNGKFMNKKELNSFMDKLETYSKKINWSKFFEDHKPYYEKLTNMFSKFPIMPDLNDVERFYNVSGYEYYYMPSTLMNGGFGASDGNKLFYNRGFEYDDKTKTFKIRKEYIVECLFHEYSHTFVNKLVDKYYDKFDINDLYEDSLKQNLPKTYQSKTALLYEYIVRCNANIMVKKYYKDAHISDWILNHGFNHLNELIEFTTNNKDKYDTYEDFFKNDLIGYMNNLCKRKIVK